MHRTSAVFALILGVAVAPTASAQTWADFGSAFQLFPCQDGWSGCRVDETVVQPDMVNDSGGMPNPSHHRVGWFDLKATASFSPFVPLSAYTGTLVWEGASAAGEGEGEVLPEPEPEAVTAADIEAELGDEGRAAVEESRVAAEAQQAAARESQAAAQAAADAKREQEAAKKREEEMRRQAEEQAKRQKDLEAQQAAASSAAEKERLRKEAEAAAKKAAEAEAARKAAEAEAKKRAEEQARADAAAKAKAEEEAKRKAEAEAKARAEEEARRKAEEEAKRKADEEAARKRAEEEAKRKAEEEARKKAEADAAAAAAAAPKPAPNDGSADAAAVVPPPPPPAGAPGSCGMEELVRLEPQAMLGKLTDGQVAACEVTLAGAPKMTDKAKVSLILMVNAFSKGDKATWEKLVKRHLDEIDQSDPDLCYKYALHLSKQGASRASGVIRWADVALENRTVWTGDTYTSRVFSLYKLRAAAAQSLWEAAEKSHAEAPSDDTASKVEKHRSMTKVMAREWYEYAKVSGKDTTTALQLCMSAAGTKDYCEAG